MSYRSCDLLSGQGAMFGPNLFGFSDLTKGHRGVERLNWKQLTGFA